MESRNYLNESESGDNYGDNQVDDKTNVLVDSNKTIDIGFDWVRTEANPYNDLPRVDVDGHAKKSHLVKSIELAKSMSSSIYIKFSLTRDSIKFLRQSLRLVEDRSEPKNSMTKRKTGHQSSTDESESGNESQVFKRVKKGSTFENAAELIGGTNETLKRFQFRVNRSEDFWFYPRNLIENGRIQVQNFPINICSYSRYHLDKRLKTSTELNPDPYTFAHVQHKEPWDESDFEQLLVPKIPKEIVKRVLKGMSQGKLYLIDITRLRKIFGSLIQVETNGKAKCPLCGKVYCRKPGVMKHLESIHTNFACFCGRCGHFFLRNVGTKYHNCPSRSKQRNS